MLLFIYFSADTALITVLILNNFSELRAFVFKKYDANHLFQLSCADTTERFQILLSLTMIFLVAINSPDAKWSQLLWWEEALFYKASLIFAGYENFLHFFMRTRLFIIYFAIFFL